ncbi:hypothetical protein GE21DRAFT_1135116 [Neurospora crassa]|nr:hypothetical protein GE21DRAFT_1135116 [Neurospora crassa]
MKMQIARLTMQLGLGARPHGSQTDISGPDLRPVQFISSLCTYHIVHIHSPRYPTCYLTYSARPISPYYPNPGTISRESQIGPPGDMGSYARWMDCGTHLAWLHKQGYDLLRDVDSLLFLLFFFLSFSSSFLAPHPDYLTCMVAAAKPFNFYQALFCCWKVC